MKHEARQLEDSLEATPLGRPYVIGERVNVFLPHTNSVCLVVGFTPKTVKVVVENEKLPNGMYHYHSRVDKASGKEAYYVPPASLYLQSSPYFS